MFLFASSQFNAGAVPELLLGNTPNKQLVHALSVASDDHRAAWQLVKRQSFIREESGTKVEVKGMTLRLMLVPENPSSSDLDEGYDKLLGVGSPTISGNHGWTQAAFNNMTK